MLDRYPCQAVLLLVFGILAGKGIVCGRLHLIVIAVLAAAVSVGICIYKQPLKKQKLRQACILLLIFIIGAVRMDTAKEQILQRSADVRDGQKTVLQGRIIKKQLRQTQDSDNSWTVYLTDSYLKSPQGIRSCGNIILYTDLTSDAPVIGNIILISGTIHLFQQARNDGNFDERAYYQNQGYSFKMYADKHAYQVVDKHTDRLREYLYELQQRFIQVFQSYMPAEEAGTLCAMLAGEKSMLSNETKQLYRESGIAHILAISGLHISILGQAVFSLLRRCRISYQASSLTAVGLLCLFGIMSGYGISTMRAVIMFGIYLGAACCGRAYDSMTGLAAAAACILLQNPCALFLAGFQFSFAAVAGVLLGKEVCKVYRPKYKLTETVLISMSIQMLTLPLTAWYYFEIPVYSLALNLLVLPFMSTVLLLGLAGGVFGMFAMHAMPAAVARTMLSGCTLFLKYFSKAGKLALRLAGAVRVTGQPKIWQLICYYLILAVCVWYAVRSLRTRKKAADQEALTADGGKSRLAVGIGAVVCMLVLFAPLPAPMETVCLDVGQGDGIYIRTSDGLRVMIDGGSTDVKQVGTYRILPFLKSHGIAKIDYWFLSHLDQDHTSGFLEIVQSGYPVGEVVCADGMVRDQAYEKITTQLSESKIKVRYLKQSDALRTKQACFRCLAPASLPGADDRNAQSLVLLYEDHGYSCLFSGDISQKEEQMLLAKQQVKKITLYKAAHHGSDSSNAQELLAALKPAVSVISCAKENSYGHPGKEAVEAIETHSALTRYTMHAGQIRVAFRKGEVNVQTFRQ